MIRSNKVMRRRDSTLFHVPLYPESIRGAVVRGRFQMAGQYLDVADNPIMWEQWLARLVRERLLLPVAWNTYSRPSKASDWAHRYRNGQPKPTPLTTRQHIANARLALSLTA